MAESTSFIINTASIAHETIDGEVVMVNLNNGSYYSTDKVGAVVWNLIDQGLTQKQIIEQIQNRCIGESREIEQSLNEFISQLQEEALITVNSSDNCSAPENGRTNGGLEIEKQNFEKPILQKFSDMQDLLLLDPIHDIDEMGWPDPKKSSD